MAKKQRTQRSQPKTSQSLNLTPNLPPKLKSIPNRKMLNRHSAIHSKLSADSIKTQYSMEQPKEPAISYLSCPHLNHDGEVLNLICLEKTCAGKGLLCSLCREQHQNHHIRPLKILLDNLQTSFNTKLAEECCNKLSKLQELKNSLLYGLKTSVERLAATFQQLQQDIMDEYQRSRTEIIEQIQLNIQLPNIIADILAGTIKAEQYRQNFANIAKWISCKDKDLSISTDYERIVANYQKISQQTLAKLSNIELLVEKQLKDKAEIVPVQPMKAESATIQYHFSGTYKGSSIEVNNSKKIAKQTQSGPYRFVLVEEGMGMKSRKIVFKVTTLRNWVGIGICLRNHIASFNYSFKYQSLGHGSFLLSNDGYTWSHNDSTDNIHSCKFLFKEGSIIEVTLSETHVEFKSRENGASFKLRIKFKEEEWPFVCFCANLCSQNDAIEILDQ